LFLITASYPLLKEFIDIDLNSSTPTGIQFEKPSTTQIRFRVDLKPNSEEVFTYGLQTSY